MGGRHSKRSMDVTTTPKKEGIPAEGDAPAVGDGKLERIEEADANSKPTTNGVAPHTDAPEDKDNVNEKESTTEKEKEKDEDDKKAAEESKPETPATESPAEGEVTTPTDGTPASPKEVTSPDTKEAKKKDKTKKKWSFRSISFSKKDKSKPVREDSPKNGDVSKEEPLAEGGEEAENPEAVSPAEDKSASSPTDSASESKATEEPASPLAATLSPAEENKEAPSSPAPTPAPEAAKEEPEVPVEKVEVSPALAAKPQSPSKISSITERKTTEDFPSSAPTSPPPTPIDPSPLQQAQQAAPNATALAEALKPALSVNDSPVTNSQQEKLPESIEIQEIVKEIDLPEVDAVPEVLEAPEVEISDSIETEIVQVVPEIIAESEIIEVTPQIQAEAETEVEITELEDKAPEIVEVSSTESETNEKMSEQVREVEVVEIIMTGQCPLDFINQVKKIEPVKDEEVIEVMTGQSPLDILNHVEKSELVKDEEVIEVMNGQSAVELINKVEEVDKVCEKTEDLIVTDEKLENLIEDNSEKIEETEDVEADIPPPLPESPIPVPKASADLMNFMASQISEDFALPEELLPPPPVSDELEKLSVNDSPAVEDSITVSEAPSPSPTEDLSPPVNPNPSVESSKDKVNGYKDIEGVNGSVNGDLESPTKDSLFQNHQVINQHQLLA